MGFKKSNDYNADVNDESQQSRLNAAGLINSTLERLWQECYTSMSNGDYIKWNTKLDAIWAILGGDEKEGGTADLDINKIDMAIYKTGSLRTKIGTGFSVKQNPNSALQYQLLKKKSLFLRRLQNKQGKGTAYANEDEDDFD